MNTSQSHLDALRIAIDKEKEAMLLQEAEFGALSAKMNQFQQGDGPAPSDEEFRRWRNSVEVMLKARSLQNVAAVHGGVKER